MLDKKRKQKIIDKFKTHAKDTGSPQVQAAILSEEIKRLTAHLKKNKHDFSSRRGLMKKIGERRRLLRYLERLDEQAFDDIIKTLKIKMAKKIHKKQAEEALLFNEAEEEGKEENSDATTDEKK